MRRRIAPLGAAAGALLIAIGAAAPAQAADPASLAERTTAEAVFAHLEQLQEIAAANGGNRAAGQPGYAAAADYIEGLLIEAGYTTERQPFETTVQDLESAALAVTGTAPVPLDEPSILEFAPSGDVTGTVIVPAAPTGCSAEEWAGVDATGSIALVQRGVCSFAEKNLAAAAAGATGVLVYNNAPGALAGTLGGSDPAFVPGFGLSDTEGAAILAELGAGPVTASLQIVETTSLIETFNLIAETPTGRDDNTVVVGAHLDSVPEGPGINDNGSGSAAILETALRLAEEGELENQVRFAWWGAEEVGLVGSYAYVDALPEEELSQIAAYLNFDMVGSPNYVVATYDADESTFPAPAAPPAGSAAVEDVFTDYFASTGQPVIDTAFDGRSDYAGFIDAGIPSSGVFTGADDIKTPEEAALFGGVVGDAHDPNYHSAEDDLDNVSLDALRITVPSIAFAVGSLSESTEAVNGVAPIVDEAPIDPGSPVTPGPPAAQEPIETLPSVGADGSAISAALGALLLLVGLGTALVTRAGRARVSR